MNANYVLWYNTDIPPVIINEIDKTCSSFDDQVKDSIVNSGTNVSLRKSKNAWIPTSNWIGGYLWYYIQRANRENFKYDLTCIDNEVIQYTHYEPGQFYGWHVDGTITNHHKPKIIPSLNSNTFEDDVIVSGEYSRKLSFVMQLSEPEEYSGGQLQFMDDKKTFFAPKQRGTIIIFDSRIPHRVKKIKSGFRKSLVGWVIGPRWR